MRSQADRLQLTITNAAMGKSSLQGKCETIRCGKLSPKDAIPEGWRGMSLVRKGVGKCGEKRSILGRYINKDPTTGSARGASGATGGGG